LAVVMRSGGVADASTHPVRHAHGVARLPGEATKELRPVASRTLEGLLGDGPEDRVDVGNIGNPRGIDSNREPDRAGNESKKDEWLQKDTRIQSA
jgi:hypothetical protein